MQGSLGALLKEQQQLAAAQQQLDTMQRRLSSINTSRPTSLKRLAAHPAQHKQQQPLPQQPQRTPPPMAPPAPPPPSAVMAQDLEQDWMAALTPGSSELEAAVAAAQKCAAAATAAAVADPFAAAAHVSFDVAEGGTMPSAAALPGLRPQHAPAVALQVQPHPGASAMQRQGSGMVRAGSASIAIPYRNMRRAETAPALTDDLIAAAVAAAVAGSASSGGASALATSAAKSAASKSAKSTVAAAPPAASNPSSAGSSYRGSPPKAPGLVALPERQASATREVFEANAEAVAALTQSKVLQQALSQVR